MLVHASNPIANLTDAQILAIYKGEIKRWSECGGPDSEITVISRAGGRSELDLITEYFSIKAADLKPSIVAGEKYWNWLGIISAPLKF